MREAKPREGETEREGERAREGDAAREGEKERLGSGEEGRLSLPPWMEGGGLAGGGLGGNTSGEPQRSSAWLTESGWNEVSRVEGEAGASAAPSSIATWAMVVTS